MIKGFRTAAAIAAATFFSVAPASAQLIDKITGDQLGAAMTAAGLNADIITDASTGAPVIRGSNGDFNFYVRALSCAGQPMACENLVFFANFSLGRTATAQDFRIVNEFNESQVFGRAYVIPETNEVGIDYVIELGGGVTEDHLSQNIGRWADVVNSFVAKFQAGYSGS